MGETIRAVRDRPLVYRRHGRRKSRVIWIGLLLAFTTVVGEVQADEVVMKNGDRISGKIKTLSAGKLRIDTSYAGTIEVDWKETAALATETPLDVEMEDGHVLRGRIRRDLQGLSSLLPDGEGEGERLALSWIVKLPPPRAAAILANLRQGSRRGQQILGEHQHGRLQHGRSAHPG